jgi:hypothetical protein
MIDRMTSRSTAIDAFLKDQPSAPPRARLIFGLDATASRQPTWDLACHLQSQMFAATTALGDLDVQLVYFRGGQMDMPAECKATPWLSDAKHLAAMMGRIKCQAGLTQIGRTLEHAKNQALAEPVQALIFVGDAMEENASELGAKATQLSDLKLPVFMFQEGDDPVATRAYRTIATASGGAYFKFDQGSAAQLSDLLRAVAAFAVGGVKALEAQGETARLLLEQLR